MDPLSDVLRAVRLTGAFFFLVEARFPWSVSAGAAAELVPRVLPNTEHLISYHVLMSGICWAGVAGEEPVRMEAGDVIVFPHGDPHCVSGSEGSAVGPVQNGVPDRHLHTVHIGEGTGARATFVCGFLGCDARPYNPLLAALPRCLHARGVATGWLGEFPRQAVAESRRGSAGGATMLTRMAELMFVEVVRRHLDALPQQQVGWLAGLRDPIIGPALTELHRRPAHQWTLAELASEVATSRSVLAERFSQVIGIPPMQYLTHWRLQLAAEQLASCSTTVAAVGTRVGYESEAAFSRAFKRATGESPGTWRRMRRGA
ncbi:MAG: AraC family transcriptional regulator [Gemmatimonadaceae bacterium]|nr:AraC family transcriptional regulator [Gemmatimonadaceae bacterium]